ncbi:MAG: thioesterase family protein [Planctomycetota bacterium]
MSTTITVRYHECDPMGVAHHAAYAIWLEMARTELLRQHAGMSYRECEETGVFFVVVRLNIVYKTPARYDDTLNVECTFAKIGYVKIDHAYRIMRGDTLIATATTTIACVDRAGVPQQVPDLIRATNISD